MVKEKTKEHGLEYVTLNDDDSELWEIDYDAGCCKCKWLCKAWLAQTWQHSEIFWYNWGFSLGTKKLQKYSFSWNYECSDAYTWNLVVLKLASS